ncbi:Carboxylesterase, partial [Teladorsagia circumcincta]
YQYTNDTYPVVVFIHGGDFQSGGGSDYSQQAILDNFVSRKIIFVTFNYRLGPLGFLSTGDKILPGNVGLWDQIWALKWVKRLHWDDYQEFVPVVDGAGGVIPDVPEDLAKHRKKIPMMIGTTLILNEKQVNFSALNSPLAEKLADNLTLGYKQFQNHRLIAEGCKAQYVWTKVDPSMSDSILFDSVLKMYSHFWYDAPASRLATYYIKQNAPVFLYSFDHISENFYDLDRAFHGADKLHLFNITPRFLIRRRDRNWQLDQRVVEIFAELIVNFARHGHPTPENSGFPFNWTSTNAMDLNYLSITDSPTMEVGFRWQGHVFWNWYARSLDAVDVGNLQRIAQLDRDVGNWQFATAMLSFCSLFFFAILVGLACYCTRKDSDDDEL